MTSLADLTIVILAGGLGTRLRPSVNHVPKVLAPINGTPFLNYVLDALIEQGGRNVLLCLGYGAAQIQAYYTDRYRTLILSYAWESEPLGTAGALRYCISQVQSKEVLVLNGDTFCDIDFNRFIAWHRQAHSKASIVLVYKEDVSRFGSVKTDSNERIIQFYEKNNRSGGGYVSAGVYLLHRQIVEKLPEGRSISMEYEVLPDLIGSGLSGYKTASNFIDIGTPNSYRRAQHYFSNHGYPHTDDGRMTRFGRTVGQDIGKTDKTAGETI
jgi:NDP-sugar pyrophosphorylase family protein